MIDIDHLRQWIGREEVRRELVTEALVDRFKATFDQEGAAVNGDAAPTMIHLCLAPPAAATSGLGPDGHPARGAFLPPVPLPRRMWAGGSFTFHGPVRVGAMAIRRSTISNVTVKQGRNGTLCFVTVDHRIESGGRLAIEERNDLAFRGIDAPGLPAKTTAAASHGIHRIQVEPSPLFLFRYSALTFNGHRIHYDLPYVKERESYPGLIVHGPLQATMLVQLAEKLRGTCPKQFDFRALSPLFDIADFTLNAADDDGGLRLWTSYVDGPVAMEARATW